jgi:cell division septum initiation protein DivIVA
VSLRRTLDVMGATVERASSFPLSASCLVNRAELLSLVERARAELPVELDEAAALLVAHQDVIARAEEEAEQVLAAARVRADEMIEDSALVATARGRSEQILDAARTEAARLLREADEYCDGRLAVFENDLERAMAQVRRGRDRLRERSDLASLDTLQAHGAELDEVEYLEYVEEYAEVEVYDGQGDSRPGDEAADGEHGVDPAQEQGHPGRSGHPADERQPVGVGAQRGHRVVDVAAMERAEAERAGLGQRVNLQ